MSNRARDDLFREFASWGFDSKGWSPRTREKYRQRVEVADAWLLANRDVSLLWATGKDLQAYLFSTPPTARNRNNIRQALVGFGAFALDRGLVHSNQALALPRLPEPESVPKALEQSQAERVHSIAQVLPPMNQALILTLLYGGLRKSECRLLEWAHIDEGFNWFHFTGKRNKTREVPIHDDLRPALRRWRQMSKEARWVFPSPRGNGRPVSDSYVKELVYMVGDIAGIDHLHPHQLRHTVATAILEAGGDITDVQAFLGHADIKTSSIYLKVRPAKVQAAMERVRFRMNQIIEENPEVALQEIVGRVVEEEGFAPAAEEGS